MILAAIALLTLQSPADQHRLTWVKQSDGTVTTFRRVGDLAVAARCRTAAPNKCVVASETIPSHIAVRKLDVDRLPMFTIGLLGDAPGYGCDWIGSRRAFAEQIATGVDGQRPRAEKLTRDGRPTWDEQSVRAAGGRWFPCVAMVRALRSTGISNDSPAVLSIGDE